jgi:hypothetical protein
LRFFVAGIERERLAERCLRVTRPALPEAREAEAGVTGRVFRCEPHRVQEKRGGGFQFPAAERAVTKSFEGAGLRAISLDDGGELRAGQRDLVKAPTGERVSKAS